jgi:DnaJ-class molecular chaperone
MATQFQDYYAVLGVPKTATEKQIRSAYRKLARQHHPDVNPNNKEAEDKFKMVNEAYEVLSDPEKRKKYDELGSRWKEYEQWERARAAQGATASPEDFAWATGGGRGASQYDYRTVNEEDLRDLFGDEDPFSDFFGTFFGRSRGERGPTGSRRRATRPHAGDDAEQPIEVSLAEAYNGTTRLLNIQQPDGSSRRLEVKIPPGVDTGSRVRMAGQAGGGSNGGPPGDLYLVVQILPDSRFERRGHDLYTKVQTPLQAMVLGGEVGVPTPDGRNLALNIPTGTQDGRTFRLRGQGMPKLGRTDQRGDLHTEVHVRLPERLTAQQRALFEEFVNAGEREGVGSR